MLTTAEREERVHECRNDTQVVRRPSGDTSHGSTSTDATRMGKRRPCELPDGRGAEAFTLYRWRGDVPSNSDATDAMMVRFKGILLAAVILMFASSIQNAVSLLGISSFVTETSGGVPAFVVPLAVFATTSFVSFSDGSSWSTYGIMFPIAVPLAFATGANLPLVLGAVFSGGIFGDHTSPISDTTVLASSTSGSDHMVHVRTQIPYALITAGLAAVLFLALGVALPESFRVSPY